VNAEVVVFPAVVGLLVQQTDHGWKHIYLGIHTENRRLRLQFERAHDDGHNGGRNMLSGGYVTKQ
jgi:hypothetical protein